MRKVRVKMPREVEVRVWDEGNGRSKMDVGGLLVTLPKGMSAADAVDDLDNGGDDGLFLMLAWAREGE